MVFKWFTGDVEKNVLMVHSDGIHQLFDADVSIPVALVNKQDLFLFSCVRLHPQLAFSVQQHLPSHPPSLFPRPPFFLGIAHGFLLIPDRLSMVFLRVPFSRQPS